MTDESPRVCAVMLTCGRPAMEARARAAFAAQTYKNKVLLVHPSVGGKTIGILRNEANTRARVETGAQILMHWDDDDYSLPGRMESQAAALVASGAQMTGYNRLLFWRAQKKEAWIWHNARLAAGTSFCYWSRVWARKPFGNFPTIIHGRRRGPGEDWGWQQGVDCHMTDAAEGPLMIASIHGGNTMDYDLETIVALGGGNWIRRADFDTYTEGIMSL